MKHATAIKLGDDSELTSCNLSTDLSLKKGAASLRTSMIYEVVVMTSGR